MAVPQVTLEYGADRDLRLCSCDPEVVRVVSNMLAGYATDELRRMNTGELSPPAN